MVDADVLERPEHHPLRCIKEAFGLVSRQRGEATTVFAEELRGWDVCKGTIRLPWKNELPTELIQRIARWCYEEYTD